MKIFSCLLFLLFTQISATASGQQILPGTQVSVSSPDKNLVLQFYQKEAADRSRTLCYTLRFKGKAVVNESALDLQLDNRLSESAMVLEVDTLARWTSNLLVKRITASSHNGSWKPVTGERTVIPDNYQAATVDLVKEDNPLYQLQLELRVYNEGAAIRYFFPENEKGTYYRIKAEQTEFSMPEGTTAFHALYAQAKYNELPLRNWPNEAERPLTLKLPNGLWTCLAEARMVDYARTKFTLSTQKPNTIVTSMYTPADLISPFYTPWRVVMVGERAGALVENNYLLLNLNDASAIHDTGWIKPGKIMRVMTQTTAESKEHIDFAVKHHLQYILFDWKWYGPIYTYTTDASKVAIPDFDLPGIIRYGKEKGVGVWLYVNMQALYRQSDSLFGIYKKWDVKGVKFGFVQVGSHRWTTWVEEMIKKAAENGLMVNIHDEWRPTGEQRTWPNLMTAEGVRGNEEMPDATHNTILPFTRFIAGPADYTFCYYDPRLKNTHAHQLALASIFYSPIQTLYWYDKPAMYSNEPELEFWDHLPTVWDETRVLQGEPGQFITTARRKGDEWFVGSITNNDARTLAVSLGFLQKGKKWVASIYSDDPSVPAKSKVKVEKRPVTAETILKVTLQARGGQAIWIRPQE